MEIHDTNKPKTAWKERLLDSWHRPWYRNASSADRPDQSEEKKSRSRSGKRKRRLVSTTRMSNVQLECAFLSRLPGEIRNEIYLLLLGNRRLSMFDCGRIPSKHRLIHHELRPDHKEVLQGHVLSSRPHPATNKLAILQTCRQIYGEAADVLYSTNCFEIRRLDDLRAFNLFTESASPTRLACITQLTVRCQVEYFAPYHPLASQTFKLWKKMWATVSFQMSGLRHLTLQLLNTSIFINIQLTPESYWVKPFLRVRNLQTFKLLVEKGESMTGDHVTNPWERRSSLFSLSEHLDVKVEGLRQHSQKLLCSPRSLG
ncbi:MAG: hypothetical protein Q9186_002621 [Xanthomendoza sp. 1 TL-2023]